MPTTETGAPPQVSVLDLPMPTGGAERVLFIAVQSARFTVVLLAGGDAVFGIDPAGNVSRVYISFW